ncbi:MAG: YegS/Rv2252/BmrU family lipid kinase [Melioribacteraceae bacterium]
MNKSTKLLLFINPKARNSTSIKELQLISNLLKENNLDHSIETSMYLGHAKELLSDLKYQGYNFLIIGGDGTLNNFIQNWQLIENRILGIIPVGSGNDFAKNLGYSKNLKKDLVQLLTSIIEESITHVNTGEIELWEQGTESSRVFQFINSVGIGFDAKVAYLNNTQKVLPGIFNYILSVLKAVKSLTPFKTSVVIDSLKFETNAVLITCGNGKTSGGGFYLTPNAKIEDDLLDFTIIKPISKLRLLKELPKALINTLYKVPEVSFHTGTKIELYLDSPVYVHADGEILSEKCIKILVKLNKRKIKVYY